MRGAVSLFVLVSWAVGLTGCSNAGPGLTFEEEFGFRQLRQDFHVACTTGDYALLRSLWADDAVVTTPDGSVLAGGDTIADALAADPNFGEAVVLTLESRWTVSVSGDAADYGFESITIDLGGDDLSTTFLANDGAQNPDVEIVAHVHSRASAVRVSDGDWVFSELEGGVGPLPAGNQVLGQPSPTDDPAYADELAFRRMREQFHRATITGDRALLRTVWADDAVFRAGPNEVLGGDAITDLMASSPTFGKVLVLTPESSSRISVDGDIIRYAFECITLSVGANDPLDTDLCAPGGIQNPAVEIIGHTHTSGFARRVAEGRWVFQEFNGALGPLAPE